MHDFRVRSILHTLVSAAAGVAVLMAGCWFSVKGWRAWNLHRATTDLVATIEIPATGFHDRIDAVRGFINAHSEHKIDDEFYQLWVEPWKFDQAMTALSRGDRDRPVHMECSTRANSMSRVLHALGYTTRRVDSFSGIDLASHSFLEVLNPETGQWETQDPDYDIYWRDSATGERVSVAASVDALDVVEPCNGSGCGWWTTSREGLAARQLSGMLDWVAVKDPLQRKRFVIYAHRVDTEARYSKWGVSARFCDLAPERCRDGMMPANRELASHSHLGRPRCAGVCGSGERLPAATDRSVARVASSR